MVTLKLTQAQASWVAHYNRFHEKFEWFIEKEMGTRLLIQLEKAIQDLDLKEAQKIVWEINSKLSKDVKENPWVRGLNDFKWLVNTDVTSPEKVVEEVLSSMYSAPYSYY